MGQIQAEKVDLSLNIGLIRLDLNGDGKGSDNESLWRIFAAVTNSERWLNEPVAQQLLTDFDSSDFPWLRAYCHLLMAMAEFPLAHDWQPAFEATFPSIFHMPQSATGRKFHEAIAEARARLKEVGPPPWKSWRQLRERDEQRLQYASIADLIAFVHLMNWPVVERDRLASVLRHLEAGIRQSRLCWKRILAETAPSWAASSELRRRARSMSALVRNPEQFPFSVAGKVHLNSQPIELISSFVSAIHPASDL